MASIKKIVIVCAGGDSPGMNAVLRAVVRTATFYGIQVYGAQLGFQGIVEGDIFLLTSASVANCIQRGGTLLQSGRFPEFKLIDVRRKAMVACRDNNIDALIVLGGDGSFRGASLFAKESGIHAVGIPCTIDNDVPGSDYAIGFDTARNTALRAIDQIRDTALSSNHNFLVEVMGRASGFLAVDVGIAGGAEMILIPEFPIAIEDLAKRLRQRKRKKLASIIIVAEADAAGRSFVIAKQLKKLTNIDYRACVLGHTQRGGAPTVYDRKIASLLGVRAVELLRQGKTQKMLAIQHDQIVIKDFPGPKLGARRFSDEALLRINTLICDF